MSIDLYLIGNCKEIMTFPQAKAISYGWGMDHRGNLRKPDIWNAEAPIVIDDSITGSVSVRFLSELLPYCKQGCILDLERKPSRFHNSLLFAMEQNHISPLWVPVAYCRNTTQAYKMVVSDLPHNSWRQFCTSQLKKGDEKWVLEYHPLQITKKLTYAKKSDRSFFLEEAVCMIKNEDRQVLYYDTADTVKEKLRIAEQCGCCGVIGIAEEWKSLKK